MPENIQQVVFEIPTEILNEIDRLAQRGGRTREEILRAATQDFLFSRNEGKFLTRKEVCSLLQISAATLARLMKRPVNPVPHVRYAKRKVRFYEPEIVGWIKKK